MKPLKIVIVFVLLSIAFSALSQENVTIIKRTPEQEAIKQTEKLQQELNLGSEQAKQVYEINLKYARERQISNTRSEAVERMKNKNAEIQQVLSHEQNNKLQTKRYERSTIESPNVNQNRPANSSFRVNQEQRTNQTEHIQPTDRPTRSTFRPTPQQTVRRSITTDPGNQPTRSNPSAVRPSVPAPTFVPRRTETPPTPNRR